MSQRSLKTIHNLIKSATEQLPIDKSFVADLKLSIEKQDQENVRIPSKSYKPSSMSCLRQMYFQIIGEEPSQERRDSCNIGITDIGSFRHEKIQEAIMDMRKYKMDCEYVDIAKFIKQRKIKNVEIKDKIGIETKLYLPDLNMSFMTDGIVKYKGQYYILEIKTETNHKFWDRKGVAENHIIQATSYSIAFNINQVLFLYECRDNTEKKCYLLEITEDMKHEVISKIEECDQYVNNLIVPPKPKNASNKFCQYCKYVSPCRKAGI
jgi:CRISPR/Cas system-associated exonuclease Cas4 (RecB family)